MFHFENFDFHSDGQKISAYSIESAELKLFCTNYGAKIISILVKDANENWIDVVAGYDTIQDYLTRSAYFGALCGRYANRLKFGQFSIDRQKYQLELNCGKHHLHGGSKGLQSKIWSIKEQRQDNIIFTTICPDSEMGYPGNLEIEYSISINKNKLKLEYSASTDKPTIVNLAPHSYFNLNGKGNILNHQLAIAADEFCDLDRDSIPTGKFRSVEGTAFDFRNEKSIGHEIKSMHPIIQNASGYDINYIIKSTDGPIATLKADLTHIQMDVFSSQPGLQLYTCNWKNKTEHGKNKALYREYSFVCLEPQHFPDSPNHSHFPNTIVRPGQRYQHFTEYIFSSKEKLK